MAGPIAVDLEDAQNCTAIDMIRFLLAFCTSNGNKAVPVCDEALLERAFTAAREVANSGDTPLKEHLTEL
jgi:hypothetical protein